MHLYSTKKLLTLAQLVDAWGAELGIEPAALGHQLIEDAVNGLFGEGEIGMSAPRADGFPGFGVLDESGLKELAQMVAATGLRVSSGHIFIKRQATLVFAARRRVAPPSWWATDVAGALQASRTWPLAPAAIDHIATAQQCTQQEACLLLQVPLLEGRIKARAPLLSHESGLIEVQPVPSEFWRYAPPGEDGTAFNLSTLIELPWFEVYLPEVQAIWPAKPQTTTAVRVASQCSQDDVNQWMREYYQSARNRGEAPPKVREVAFPACRVAIGAIERQMKAAMKWLREDPTSAALIRSRGGRDRSLQANRAPK